MAMDVKQAYEALQNLDVQDLRRIGVAPKPVQYLVIVLIAIAVLVAAWYVLVSPKLDELEQAEQEEQELREEFETMQQRAANLEIYKKQLEQMRESFGAMLRQLPGETDMENLLVDLSQTSVAAGLEVKYFKPGSERKREFYAEYPIELRVVGTYHEFGSFVSGLASLPRIVTLHNIEIQPMAEPSAGQASDARLEMTLTAKTYRYLSGAGGQGGSQ